MSWRDKLNFVEENGVKYNAKFREAPFFVSDVDTGIGRRNVLHQYPNRDNAYLEDLGMDADEFVINGYVIQRYETDRDYFAERDNLIKALKSSGTGTLIHPFLGELKVGVLGKVRVVEDFSKGGMARFTMTFVKSGLNEVPVKYVDIDLVDKSVDDCIDYTFDNTIAILGSAYGGTDFPLNSDTRLRTITSKSGVDAIIGAFGSLNSWMQEGMIGDATSFISKVKTAIQGVRGGISSTVFTALNILTTNLNDVNYILNSPLDLANFIRDSVDTFLNLIGLQTSITKGIVGQYSGKVIGEDGSLQNESNSTLSGENVSLTLGNSVVDAVLKVTDFGDDLEDINVTTENKAKQDLNRLYMINAVRNLSLGVAAKVAVRIGYESYEEALSTMNKVVDDMEDQLVKLGDEAADTTYSDYGITDDNNQMYTAIDQLRKTFVTVMKDVGASLAVIIDYEVPPDGMTTLELAYDRYSDLDRADNIYERNRLAVRHPGFLPGGQTIEILNE